MVLFHYSNRDFNNFEIDEKLLNTNFSSLQEGLGIYCSTNNKFKNYGKIKYTLMVKGFYDFTKTENIIILLDVFLRLNDKRNIFKQCKNEYYRDYIKGVASGDYSITNMIKNLWDCIEENVYQLPKMYYHINDKIYDLDLLEYEKNLIQKWNDFLQLKPIKYFDKNFNTNVYVIKNTKVINRFYKEYIKSEVK